MKILIIGATGPLGKEILKLAKKSAFKVFALARNPSALSDIEGIEVFKGDIFDLDSLRRAMSGVDAVISAFGLKLTRKPTTLLSEGTRNMLQVMKEARITRFVCVTGNGAGDSKGHGGFLFDRILEPLLLHEMYKDKTRQEEVIRGCDLDWTIVRPAVLTYGSLTGHYKIAVDLSGFKATKISRNDVADFIVNELKSGKFKKQAVSLSY